MKEDPAWLVQVFTKVLQLPAEERARYLDHACPDDDDFRRQVEALLKASETAGDFMEKPAATDYVPRVATGVKPGDRIGRYKLLQQIGEGGWGVVFMAEQETPVRRMVAFKIIKAGMDTKSVIARFEAERQALAMMDHPNIATVFDAGATESGSPYFVMELVHGIKLTEYCDKNELSTTDRLNLFIQVCQAVQHAHQKGIIHRDLKPSNILVTTTTEGSSQPKVIDFGIAKATSGERLTDKTLFTAFELLIGTPAYMSPEQAALTSVDVDTRTDIYSLGVLLYELLTSTTPFDTRELLKAGLDEVRRVIRNEEPVRPSARLSTMGADDLTGVAGRRQIDPPRLIRTVSGDLDWIVMKALEKDRSRRYQTASGLARDVQHYLAGEAISARPPSAFYRLQKTLLRNKLFFTSVGIIILLLAASLIGATWLLKKEKEARNDANAARLQAEADKTVAQSEASRSRQVTQFLREMLEGVGPSVALGRDTTMLREILEKTTRRMDTELADQPAVRTDLLEQLARTYWELGQYEQSESMLRQAFTIATTLWGEESDEASHLMDQLGHVLSLQSKDSESEAIIRKALAIRLKLFGEDSLKAADSITHLGGSHYSQKRYGEAEQEFRRSLAIYRRHLDKADSRMSDSLIGLGSVLYMQGKLGESEAIFREALSNSEPALGGDHPTVTAVLQNLAAVLGDQGKLEEAEGLTRRVVETRRKLFGESHPLLISSWHSLAAMLMRRQKFEEAESLYRQALALTRELHGDLDPKLGRLFRELGAVLLAQQKQKDFEAMLDAFLTPSVISNSGSVPVLNVRLEFFARSGRWKKAATDASTILQHDPGEHMSYHTLAPLLVANKDWAGYRSLCQEIVARFTETSDPYVADRMAKDCLILPASVTDLQPIVKMADTAVSAGKGQSALPFFQFCKALAEYRQEHFDGALDWARKALGSKFPYIQAEASAVSAMAHFRMNQVESARKALAKAAAVVETELPRIDSGNVGDDWRDLIIAHALLAEARTLIEGAPSPTSGATEE